MARKTIKVVEVEEVRETIREAINGDGSVTTIEMGKSPWGENRHFSVSGAL